MFLGRFYFLVWRVIGCVDSFFNRRVIYGFIGGNGVVFKFFFLNVIIFGNIWRFGERIYVRN